jgi:hypothetical protein
MKYSIGTGGKSEQQKKGVNANGPMAITISSAIQARVPQWL